MRRLAITTAAVTAAIAVPAGAAAAPTQGSYVKGPVHTRVLAPPRTIACAGHRLQIGVKVPRSAFPRHSYLSVNVYLRSPHSPGNSAALQKRTFFYRKPGSDTWDLPDARCGRSYVVSYDVKVHGRRKGTRDFRVTIEPRTTARPAAAPTDPVRAIDPGPFALHDAGTWDAQGAVITDLARSMKPATVAAVMRDVNRQTRTLGGTRAVRGVAGVANGYRWAPGDDAVSTWYPQGITTSADATDDGKWGANRIQLVSWYGKGARAAAGVRISFVQANKLNGARYRHVLLVEPYRHPDGSPDFRAVKIHAGGIAWYGGYVYVADTHAGLRVFDVRRMLQVTSSSKGGVGLTTGGRFRAAGYKYVLPQVSAYTQPAGGDLVFSFVSVDRASGPPSLLTGEYRQGKPGARLVRWPLDAPSDRLAGGAGVHADGAYVVAQTNVQGALSAAGHLFLSTSAGASRNGSLFTATPGRPSHRHAWGVGAEDLTYSPLSGRIYSLTEHPGLRAVYAVPAAALP